MLRTLLRRLAVPCAVLSLGLPVVAAAPASAAVDPSAPTWYETAVTQKSVTYDVTRYDQRIGSCQIYQPNISCTVRADRTATRTIETAFGLSVAGVAASLNISSQRSQAIYQTCTGTPNYPKQPYYVGYARGESWKYTISQRKYEYGRLVQTNTQVKYAFNPTGMTCGVSALA